MKKILYSSKELDLLKGLLKISPEMLVNDFNRIVLDFGNYYLEFFSEIFPAASQNKSDEAIVTGIRKVEETYKTSESEKILKDIGEIKEIYVVRTLLHFSDEKPTSFFLKFWRVSKEFFYKKILHKNLPAIDVILSDTTSRHSEYVSHPKSKSARNVNPEYSNLLDVGVLLVTKNGLIPIFSRNNGYGYFLIDRKSFYSPEESAKFIGGAYEFIQL